VPYEPNSARANNGKRQHANASQPETQRFTERTAMSVRLANPTTSRAVHRGCPLPADDLDGIVLHLR
jgi:hypothetical protein